MSFVLDTSHFEMPPLNDVAPMKMELISVTLDTSHSSIAPSAPSKQSESRDDLMQLSTALLSFAFDCADSCTSQTANYSWFRGCLVEAQEDQNSLRPQPHRALFLCADLGTYRSYFRDLLWVAHQLHTCLQRSAWQSCHFSYCSKG